jgi:hypothetical protein
MGSAGSASPHRVRNSSEDGVDRDPRPVVAVRLGAGVHEPRPDGLYRLAVRMGRLLEKFRRPSGDR